MFKGFLVGIYQKQHQGFDLSVCTFPFLSLQPVLGGLVGMSSISSHLFYREHHIFIKHPQSSWWMVGWPSAETNYPQNMTLPLLWLEVSKFFSFWFPDKSMYVAIILFYKSLSWHLFPSVESFCFPAYSPPIEVTLLQLSSGYYFSSA